MVTLLLISIFIFTYYPHQQRQQIVKALENKIIGMANMVALGTGIALNSHDFSAVSEMVNWAKQDTNLLYIALVDNDGTLFASYNPFDLPLEVNTWLKKSTNIQEDNLYHTSVPIKYRDSNYGTLFLGYSLKPMDAWIKKNTRTTLITIGLILTLGITIALAFSHFFSKPILQLEAAARAVAEGNYHVHVSTDEHHDEVGRLAHAFNLMAQNIQKAIEDLRTSEARLEGITSTIGDGVCVISPDGEFTYLNPEAELILGYAKGELIGKNIHTTIHCSRKAGKRARRADKCKLYRAIVSGKKYDSYDDTFWTKSGRAVPVAYVVKPLIKDKQTMGAVMAFHDIKERKEHMEALKRSESHYHSLSEQLAATNEMKDLLLDVITHDLKNPAGVIQGMSEVMQTEFPGNEMVDLVKDSSDSLLQVINNATTLSKVALNEDIEKEPLDLADVVADTIKDFSMSLEDAGMTIENRVSGPLIVNANPLISEVIKNYLSNAIKYAREGKKIVVEAKRLDDSIVVAVKDFGTPIAREDYHRIFERRTQLGEGRKRGRGLGLAIVQRIAKAHGGEVWVEPNNPTGNTFYLKLPVE
jgi:PAS domain S-box-containing protein